MIEEIRPLRPVGRASQTTDGNEGIVPSLNPYLSAGGLSYAERIIRDAVSSGTPIPAYLIRPAAEVFKLLGSADVLSGFCVAGQDSGASRQPARPVRVLFVGGNENQWKLVPSVRTQLKERAPHVEVQFIFLGWSGNWPPHLDKVKKNWKGTTC